MEEAGKLDWHYTILNYIIMLLNVHIIYFLDNIRIDERNG